MRVCLENTKHIVLMGYSLPPDDVIYRAMLSAHLRRSQPPVYCTVVVGTGGRDEWLKGEAIRQLVKADMHDSRSGAETIQAAIDIFGRDRVRAYTAGIPSVFGMPPCRERIRDLLYPVDAEIDCFTQHGVCR